MPTKISPVGSSASSGGSGGGTIGGLVTGGTQGSVLFVGAGGVLAQDNTNFFWDNTAKQVKLRGGDATNPPIRLDRGNAADDAGLYSDGTGRLLIRGGGYAPLWGALPGIYICHASNAPLVWSSTISAIGTADIGIERKAAGILKVNDGGAGGGALEFLEQTAPSAATANSVRIYAQDNGAGKTQLMALFATGAAQQIAIQP